MLTPEDLDRAGELVSAAYVQVESEMLDYLVRRMLEGDVSGQRAQTAILLLAQSARPQLEAILAEHADEIDGAVQREVEGALMRSDAADLDYIRRGLGVELPALTTRQTAATCAGVVEILQRHNLGMVQAAQDAFVRHGAEAMVQVNTGAMTTERALHRAVRRLEAEGITMVDYVDPGTGRATVSNHVDVAVRRHVRTQIAQAGERLTERRMDEAGVEFVEVSSHSGARESHRAWEGRVYSRHGDRTVDGVRYRDFHAACNYGDVADGIYGANCRHSHGPYIPGMPRAYGPNPEHPSGLSNDEVYELTQEQRRRERGIRAAKRELRGAQLAYEEDPSPANLAEVNRAKQKLRNRQEAMRGFIDEANGKCRPGTAVLQRSPRREWAGDMPKGAVPKASGRSISDMLNSPSMSKQIERAGTSKTAVGIELREILKADGIDGKTWQFLDKKLQQEYIDATVFPSSFIVNEKNLSNHGFVHTVPGTGTVTVRRDASVVTLKSGQQIYFASSISDAHKAETIRQFRKLPRELKQTVKRMEVVDYDNPADAYWRATYSGFTKSAGTGGRSRITLYGCTANTKGADLLGYIAHEAGHCYDDSKRPAVSSSRKWQQAVAADTRATSIEHITPYGVNGDNEEFAESVKWLVLRQNGISLPIEVSGRMMEPEEAFVNRFELLREMLKYGR